jgi:hypothetical protein
MKFQYALALLLLTATSTSAAERTVSYARANQNITIDLGWNADNYGTISWETSTDDGATWNAVANNQTSRYTFKITTPMLCRAVVKGDPSCPDVISEREIKLVNFTPSVSSTESTGADLSISQADFSDADIVEYGFTSTINGLGRAYNIVQRTKVGDSLPDDSTSFTIHCTGLRPNTTYSLAPYFVTADGSLIFGATRIATTKAGIEFDSEDWTIEKNSMRIPFTLAGVSNSDDITPELWFGKDENSLKKYNITSLGNGKYLSQNLRALSAGTNYIALVKATINGEEISISKTVRTCSNYSNIDVDETVTPVSHNVKWNSAGTLTCLTPEDLQVEYPRMCRVDENKILFTYHGGASDHWKNSYLRKSYDNGKTWTDPVTIYDASKEFLGSKYYRICNPEMTRLQNGWIILTVVANANPETNDNCKVLASLSKDGGESWSDPIIVGRGRTWEPQVVQLPNGEVELLVSSEADWWGVTGNINQQILSARSTDNGETWTTFKRASYKPGARDGMPVAVVMQGNKGVLFVEESVNGGVPPSLVHRSLNEDWDSSDWDGTSDSYRWNTGLNSGAGAPHMIQLPTGEFLIMAHTNQTGDVWQTCRPQVIVADNTGHNFKFKATPLSNTYALASGTGAYYNSFFLHDDNTVWMLVTKAVYNGSTRVSSDIMMLEGKIIEQQ